MISFIAQGSVGKAITIAETNKVDGNLSQISQMILSAAMIKEGQNKTLLNFLNNSDEITPILKDLLSAWILMGLNDEVNANRIFDKTAQVQGMGQFANFHRAMSQLAAGKIEQAERTFSLIHKDQGNPTRRSVIFHTKILLFQGRFTEAQTLLEKWFGPTFDPEIEELFLNATNEKSYPKNSFLKTKIAIADVFHSIANLISKEKAWPLIPIIEKAGMIEQDSINWMNYLRDLKEIDLEEDIYLKWESNYNLERFLLTKSINASAKNNNKTQKYSLFVWYKNNNPKRPKNKGNR